MLFGKNSDRQRNEAQAVELLRAGDHPTGSSLACTYITIPQVGHTNAALLCRPFWTWGAEMGANEYGVVIGNQGLHARSRSPETEALTGMDLVRLALERACTAREAAEVIAALLKLHGQGGNCGHITPAFYNNGFIIADAKEAFVLETVGGEWLLERVRGVRSLSNRFSIGADVEAMSSGLDSLVDSFGRQPGLRPDYAEVIADPHRDHIGTARERRRTSTALLKSRDGVLEAADMMRILRNHGAGDEFQPHWTSECQVIRTLCMHAGAEDRSGQTVGSLVSEVSQKSAVHWVTGTAAPCISIFKPVFTDADLPSSGPPLTDRYNPSALWWRHEALHRAAVAGNFGEFLASIDTERDQLETEFRRRVAVAASADATERSNVVAECWEDARRTESRWRRLLGASHSSSTGDASSGWDIMNKVAGLDERALRS